MDKFWILNALHFRMKRVPRTTIKKQDIYTSTETMSSIRRRCRSTHCLICFRSDHRSGPFGGCKGAPCVVAHSKVERFLVFACEQVFTRKAARANGLKTKLNPHQSIFIREINITHTTPNHYHHKPIQPKHFSSWCNKLLAKLWLQSNNNLFLKKNYSVDFATPFCTE